jgi:hypothetical protein
MTAVSDVVGNGIRLVFADHMQLRIPHWQNLRQAPGGNRRGKLLYDLSSFAHYKQKMKIAGAPELGKGAL